MTSAFRSVSNTARRFVRSWGTWCKAVMSLFHAHAKVTQTDATGLLRIGLGAVRGCVDDRQRDLVRCHIRRNLDLGSAPTRRLKTQHVVTAADTPSWTYLMHDGEQLRIREVLRDERADERSLPDLLGQTHSVLRSRPTQETLPRRGVKNGGGTTKPRHRQPPRCGRCLA